ncbi:wax ester synthase/diacylglycerol acyltransferase 4-like [Macadamia integrifolia]|uniref:wax ester synthase/diacylglycerol acyltransferase 4-like n=1 Tax=Macadamia integrifolia TaxID=60698 RepID=UPI001C5339E0|nr:wax ester synthase/diacylglycerol acyltransferase 4-like [Macadamia integrifolia]
MEFNGERADALEEVVDEPVSPTGQYFNSSVLSISILATLEIDIPIAASQACFLLNTVFLPINPRFSSLMVRDEHGVKQWKRVDVKVEDHVHVPIFPDGLSLESNDEYLQEYLSKIAMERFPQSRPLWEIHLIQYPTSNAAGSVIFKLHHALGDGFSLMGALFNCLKRADNPSVPLTFPSSRQGLSSYCNRNSFFKRVTGLLSMILNTTSDFAWSILKSSFLEDDRTPIRAGNEGVEFRPIGISTVTFSLDQIKQIKEKLGGTINDVITGIIFYGTRLYMQNWGPPGSSNSKSTALVLLNTRIVTNYQSLQEMIKADSKSPWGNRFVFLHVPIPNDPADAEMVNPLDFVYKVREIIKRKRGSLGVFLTGELLEMMRKFRGPETTAQYIHSTLKNTSMVITNMIGPMEQMALADHPVRGMYFVVVGSPQSLTVSIVSYMGKLRVAVGAEKGFIDDKLYASCLENAFTRIFKAALCST